MKRRDFVKSATIAVPVTIGGVDLAAAAGKEWNWLEQVNEDNENILVLVQLNGGNDGLNTIIPVDQYSSLFKARKNILLPENQLLKLEKLDNIMFHPKMAEMKTLFDEEKMSILQNVGYPNPNLSHFRSTDIWMSGSDSKVIDNTGWIGRYLANQHPEYPEEYPSEAIPDPLAITVDSLVSNTCQSATVNTSIAVNNLNSFAQLESGGGGDIPNTPYGDELKFIIQSIAQSNAYGKVIEQAAGKGSNMSTQYDSSSELASQLKIVAKLVSGGLKTKVYVVKLGGFDTHNDQVLESDPSMGNHARLLADLSSSISAFMDDLKLLGISERVVAMTFSEFGRRIASNSSFGTDHGEAAPLMLVGDKVSPVVHGVNPTIPDTVQQKENIEMQIDFRSVYGSLLIDLFDLEESVARQVVHPNFEYIPLLKGSEDRSLLRFLKKLDMKQNYPNPVKDYTTIDFKVNGSDATMEIYDNFGRLTEHVFSKRLAKGMHSIKIDMSNYKAGSYHCVLREGSNSVSKTMIKR